MHFVIDILIGVALGLLFAAAVFYTIINAIALMDERYKRR